MKITSCFRSSLLALCLSLPLCVADGDDEWKKVVDVIEGIKNPAERPKTREEAIAKLKQGLTDFDAARAAATKAAPEHPARWDAALFEAMVAGARSVVGVPAPAGAVIGLEEILKAADAKPETKSEASVVLLMEPAEEAEAPGGDTAAWVAKAEKHLQDYPNEKMNPMVAGKVESIKAAAELMSKPLDLKFTAVDGREVELSKLAGKVVLIDFWATWCGPCVAELPNVLKAYETYHDKGFEIIGISLDQDKAALESFVKERGMEWPQYFDGKGWQNEISTKYGIQSIPAMWLVNKKGMVVNTNARAGLAEQVAKLLEE